MTAKLPYLKVILLFPQWCCVAVKAVIVGSGDVGLILSVQKPCLRLGRSLWGMPCASWAAMHPGTTLARKQTGWYQPLEPWRER